MSKHNDFEHGTKLMQHHKRKQGKTHNSGDLLFHIITPFRRKSFEKNSPGSSSWHGIDCKPGDEDSYTHVSRLDFGTPPNPSCKKTATFPHLIFSLPFLQSTFFFHCFSGTKTALTVPTTGLLNSSLQHSLRSNPALAGPIPPQISLLKSLQVLTLSQNRLSRDLGLFSLTSLIHLDLSYNSLTGTLPAREHAPPIAFGSLAKLQELRLSNSGYSGQIPLSLSRLANLSTLSLQNNQLTGEIPVGFGNLSHIYHLNLSRNSLSDIVPFDAGFLSRLGKNLDLSGNPGLFLNPNEAYNVKVGVDLCNNGSSSLFSQSPSSTPNQTIIIFLLHAIRHWVLLLLIPTGR
ncbi:hypothetical protein MLD38_029332 [Melastoma candidum]|uniref:Uncharacterized protein n=1 Tax=Melastoma candidum TaxID=119954 RepID=A0ACB9N7R4_9MYRT|nr:hypothetical protein MLD38_029332 [Melastoma candidum]